MNERFLDLPFTHKPGRRERHLRRQHNNPLFSWPPVAIEPEVLLEAQRADHEEMEAFRLRFAELLQRAVDLPSDVGSEEILSLKEALEQAYEQTHGLPEDHAQERDSLKRLIAVIMKTLWRQAATDPLAQQELSDEEQARDIHFRLLEQPLVADLLYPQSPIEPEELCACLLDASEAEAQAAAGLFEPDQLASLAQDAAATRAILAEAGLETEALDQRIALLRSQANLTR